MRKIQVKTRRNIGQYKCVESVWDVNNFVSDLVSVFESAIKEKNLKFIKFMDIKHENVYCDATRLRQIYLNIISNAVKYTPNGGEIKLRAAVKIAFHPLIRKLSHIFVIALREFPLLIVLVNSVIIQADK